MQKSHLGGRLAQPVSAMMLCMQVLHIACTLKRSTDFWQQQTHVQRVQGLTGPMGFP